MASDRPPMPRWALALLVSLAVAVLGTGTVVALQAGSAQDVAVGQSGTVARVCADDPSAAARAGADCAQAVAVARDGVNGLNGTDGVPGVGVLGTSIANGRLVIAYSDGRTQDVGQVVGEDGKVGPGGRGIRGTVITGGRLVVTFTDGASLDAGPVVGPAGRGIASLDGSTGRLVVTLTDGTVIDVGPLPTGPKGDEGNAGAAGPEGRPAPVIRSSTKTYTDGTVETCTRSGGTDTDPAFQCERTTPPVAPETTDPQPPPTVGG